ncbi:hypothetical protein MIR68_002310 [Amoeboaphelidium protococcarum]|nr:hypothetical protein MIR68_002310 [Amoeboaphelidium protococcarum]
MTQDATLIGKVLQMVSAISGKNVNAEQDIKVDEKCTLTDPVAKMQYLLAGTANETLLGTNNGDRAGVHQWINYSLSTIAEAAANNDVGAQKQWSTFVNEWLQFRTFMVSNHVTLSDYVVYVYAHDYLAKTTDKRRVEICNLVRWFDLIQNQQWSRQYLQLPLIEFDLVAATAPTVDNNKEKQKNASDGGKQAKKSDGSPGKKAATPNGNDKQAAAADGGKKQKSKEKKEKKPAASAASDEVPAWNPARLKMLVGKIVEVKQHENADSLYVEQIDVGEAQPRTIVSGLVKHVPLAEMQDRLVVILANLKPASMRGVKSEGMVLCATGSDGKVELLNPPADSTPGDVCYFEGFHRDEWQSDAVLNPKKKVWETIQPALFTDDQCDACYQVPDDAKCQLPELASVSASKLMTKKGVVRASTVTKGTIK